MRDPAHENTNPQGHAPRTTVRATAAHLVRRAAIILGISYLILVTLMLALENKLVFFPSVYPSGDWQPHGLRQEDAWIDTADGVRLHGWYVPSSEPTPTAIVLIAHGNAGNLSDRTYLIEPLTRQLNCTVLIFDYRGYGRSQGEPSEAGLYADARAARQWLAQRAGVDPQQIVLLGESLGGGVMVDLAAAEGARGLILLNTFNTLPDVAAFHYPMLPARWLMRNRFDSVSKIARYHGPLLQIHGDSDTIIPITLAEQLYQAALQPKEWVVIPGGDHNDAPAPQVFRAIRDFLSRLPQNDRTTTTAKN